MSVSEELMLQCTLRHTQSKVWFADLAEKTALDDEVSPALLARTLLGFLQILDDILIQSIPWSSSLDALDDSTSNIQLKSGCIQSQDLSMAAAYPLQSAPCNSDSDYGRAALLVCPVLPPAALTRGPVSGVKVWRCGVAKEQGAGDEPPQGALSGASNS
eukprot:351343-Chlamydomonas_euryale.AAC.3